MPPAVELSKGRFEAFSDGVFAIAITLLVLAFNLPAPAAEQRYGGIVAALAGLWPQYIVYVASFITIGIMWINHHALFHRVERIGYGVLIANLALLLLVSFLPFPTEVLGRYGLNPPAIAFYGGTLFGLALAYRALFYLAAPARGKRSFVGFLQTWRVWTSVGFFAYAAAVAVGFVSPTTSIVIFALTALYYALPGSIRSLISHIEGSSG